MGFWRNFGYFINILWILSILITTPFTSGLSLLGIWIPILFLYLLRKGAKDEEHRNYNKQMAGDMKDLKDLAYSRNKHETRVMSEKDYKRYLEDNEKWK